MIDWIRSATQRLRAWLAYEDAEADPRHVRRQQRLRMMAMGILVPTLLALIYYAVFARPEYDTEMKFTIQGLEQQQPDMLAGIGLPAVTRTSNDGMIVVEFIQSGTMVERLQEEYGFDLAFGGWSFDPWARISPSAAIERKRDYWLGQVSAAYDATSNVITVNVRAFTPEESLRIAEGVLTETERVVNSLNSRVQDEAVRVASEEVDQRRGEYNQARRRVIASRANRSTTIAAEATAQIGLVGALDAQLATTRVERAAAIAQFRPNSPQIEALDERIVALEEQRNLALGTVRGGPGPQEASRDISAETAMLDYQFAQTTYYGAIQARQQAIATRANERRYLVAFVPPRLAEVSNYWGRFANVFAIAVAAALLMGVATLGYSVVKDHME
jgi:capsular polysaccharide transport system permease protein